MDLAYSKEHINTFAILSGDSDFSPLVSKLKELGKHVIGLGMQQSTSALLRDNCDEFIYYEDLGQTATLAPTVTSHLPDQKRKAFELLMESLLALRRENKEVLWSSMIKDTMKRKKPSFNETYHGYRTFSEMLEDAQREGLLELETDKRSRTYVVTRFGNELQGEQEPAQTPVSAATPAPVPVSIPGGDTSPVPIGRKKSRGRRRRGQGAGLGNGNGAPSHQGGPTPVQNFEPVVIPPGPAAGIVVVTPSPVPIFDEGVPEEPDEEFEPEPVREPAPMAVAEPKPEPVKPRAEAAHTRAKPEPAHGKPKPGAHPEKPTEEPESTREPMPTWLLEPEPEPAAAEPTPVEEPPPTKPTRSRAKSTTRSTKQGTTTRKKPAAKSTTAQKEGSKPKQKKPTKE